MMSNIPVFKNNLTLSELWNSAYKRMVELNLPVNSIAVEKSKRVSEDRDVLKNATLEELGYFLTEHFYNRNVELPQKVEDIILNYRIKKMNEWNWPEWGYKDVKHLKGQ